MELSVNQEQFLESCKEARKLALSFGNPLVVHHYDADGVSSGAIAVGAMRDAGKKVRSLSLSKLDDSAIELLSKEKEVIFTDLGGGNKRVNELADVLIIDHHETSGIDKLQINPMLFGIDGSDELSSSGAAYCVFRSRDELAIVGAVGDMQYPLRGMNRWVLEQSVQSGSVRVENELRFYGRYCRMLMHFLQYSDDPYIPMISYQEDRVKTLLSDLAIDLKKNDKWRTYSDLSPEEKTRLISAIAAILISKNMIKKAEQLIGESYIFPKRKKDETFEANEFSTLLNACGRHKKADVGLRVCLEDEGAFSEARLILAEHRKMIKEGIVFATGNVQDFGKFKFLDARNRIDESIIGTVIGMALVQTWKKPIIGFSSSDNNTVKVSSRTPRHLLEKGLDLGKLMRLACEEVGGIGGGHRIAAGATIPKDKINEFLLSVGSNLDG